VLAIPARVPRQVPCRGGRPYALIKVCQSGDWWSMWLD
jgi:hypothetical protein